MDYFDLMAIEEDPEILIIHPQPTPEQEELYAFV